MKLKSELQNAVDRLRQKLYDLEVHSQDKQNRYTIDKQQWDVQRLELTGKINEVNRRFSLSLSLSIHLHLFSSSKNNYRKWTNVNAKIWKQPGRKNVKICRNNCNNLNRRWKTCRNRSPIATPRIIWPRRSTCWWPRMSYCWVKSKSWNTWSTMCSCYGRKCYVFEIRIRRIGTIGGNSRVISTPNWDNNKPSKTTFSINSIDCTNRSDPGSMREDRIDSRRYLGQSWWWSWSFPSRSQCRSDLPE